MHAVVIAEPGGPDVLHWDKVPNPTPTDGEVLIDIVAAGVNRADLLQRQGFYPPPPCAPSYPGLECSGTIAEVGPGITGWQPGDEVCALLEGGGYAERVAVAAVQVLPRPSALSLTAAAGLPETVCTVYSNLFQKGGADVILDIMGAKYLARNTEALAVDGRLVIIGTQGGNKGEINLGSLMMKRASIYTTGLRSRPHAQKALVVEGVRRDVWPLIESGQFSPVIEAELPMKQAPQAHRLMDSSDHIGKILLLTGANRVED
jgi:NADPH:quinone reductase-like Zn-dependent oxidoreductase